MPPILWVSKTGALLGVQGDPDDREICSWILGPIVLALSFMHCKNVRHVENVPGGKFERAKRRRGEKPSLRYYTLEIDAMKQTLRSEGQSESVGIKQALHICRGHFKDYRQSGLFGKVKGIFWWDSAVKGSVEAGAVVKDYSVKAPKAKQGALALGGG